MTATRPAALLAALLLACHSTPAQRASPVAPPAPQIPGLQSETVTIPGTTVTFDMVRIPGGKFRMLDGAEVDVKPFWIGRHEVTWDEFELYWLVPPSEADAVARPSPAYEPPDWGMGRGRHPVTSIRRKACEAYGEWLSKKTGKAYLLPTEAEWEFACRAGGDGTPPAPLGEHAWFAGNSAGTYHEVGQKQPNAFGLHDSLGNVWEYCSGPFSEADDRPVLRGGSYRDAAGKVHAGSRTPLLEEEWSPRDPGRPKSPWWLTDGPFVGFRLARSAD